MAAKLSSKGMLGIAMVLGLLTSVMVYNYLQGVTDKNTKKDMVPVVVAKVDILPKTHITADMIQISYAPPDYLQPGAVQDVKETIGILAREKIIAGEQITNRRLLIDGKSVGFTGQIPLGKRAMTVAVTEVTGVAGFIKPGDYVDIMVTFDQSTAGDYIGDVILQKILVLAANHTTELGANDADKDKKEPVKTATVTLAVDPALVHYLAVGDDRGKIRLALRPYLAETETTMTKAISVRELMGKAPAPEKEKQNDAQPTIPATKPERNESGNQESKVPLTEGKGILMIRGTKVMLDSNVERR